MGRRGARTQRTAHPILCDLRGYFSFVCRRSRASVSNDARAATTPDLHQTLSLDQGWRFHLGDIPLTAFGDSGGLAFGPPDITDSDGKTGTTWGAAATHFDDKAWRVLDLPHDWEVEQPFDQRQKASAGYRQRGIGWYRRQFRLDASDHGSNNP